jgi:hypothetical protein
VHVRRRHSIAFAALAAGAAGLFLLVQAGPGSAGAAGGPVATKAKVKTKTFTQSQVDDRTRYEVICPRGQFPYGGGMSFSPAPADAEGVYPNSYERLGVQHGYHITAALVDLRGGGTTARNITLQVVCGPDPPKITPPHKTVDVKPGEQKSSTMKCPGRRQLIGGGHQRTTRVSDDGNFVTTSRATSSKAWTVAGTAVGKFGGEMTGIAYCVQSKKPLLKEISATVAVPGGRGNAASATTGKCPKGRTLVFTGFSSPADGSVLWLGSSINGNGTTTAWGMSTAGGGGTLTAYGYCLNLKRLTKK